MAQWVEVAIDTDSEAAEALVGVLRLFCPDGVVATQGLDGIEADGSWDGSTPAGPVSIRGYVPEGSFDPAAQRRIEEAVWHLSVISPNPVQGPRFRVVQEEDWASNWKQHYHAQRIGQRLLLAPTWETVTPAGDDVVIRLDPGAAFGTGLHPTTRLALRLLEHAPLEGSTVLDAGTGSGVLAIAAVRLGASHAYGVDTHTAAVTVARENAAANGLERQVTICAGSVPPADGPAHYDVVVANIIAKVLQELAPALTAAVAPGGRLLLSGIIEPAAIETLITFALHGFVPVTGLAEGDWRAYRLEREA